MTEPHAHLTLVLGGARSGKSRYAEALVTAQPAPWTYIATAQVLDGEMGERVALHQDRRGEGWTTVEEPMALPEAVAAASGPVLVDCLTLWLTNLMLAETDRTTACLALEQALKAREETVVLVSNEVGLGIVPDNALARAFRDEQGRLNQRMAALSASVVLMVAGLPVRVR